MLTKIDACRTPNILLKVDSFGGMGSWYVSLAFKKISSFSFCFVFFFLQDCLGDILSFRNLGRYSPQKKKKKGSHSFLFCYFGWSTSGSSPIIVHFPVLDFPFIFLSPIQCIYDIGGFWYSWDSRICSGTWTTNLSTP